MNINITIIKCIGESSLVYLYCSKGKPTTRVTYPIYTRVWQLGLCPVRYFHFGVSPVNCSDSECQTGEHKVAKTYDILICGVFKNLNNGILRVLCYLILTFENRQ